MSDDGRVFVTGGSGFIGSVVVRRFESAGQKCMVLDQVPPKDGSAEFRKIDICDLDQCVEALQGAKRVVHLAGLVADGANKNPYLAVTVNIGGTANVLEACARVGAESLVYASTFFVFENCGLDRVDEETTLDLTTMGPFARSKFFCEQLAQDYAKKHELGSVGLRFGSVYGPGEGSNVIRTFVEQAVAGEEISVWGEGKRHRQFIHLDDVADSVVKASGSKATGVLNIAGEAQTTTREVLEIVQESIPSVNVSFDPTKPEKVQPYRMSLERAKREIGWTPQVGIKEGIENTIDWFKQQSA